MPKLGFGHILARPQNVLSAPQRRPEGLLLGKILCYGQPTLQTSYHHWPTTMRGGKQGDKLEAQSQRNQNHRDPEKTQAPERRKSEAPLLTTSASPDLREAWVTSQCQAYESDTPPPTHTPGSVLLIQDVGRKHSVEDTSLCAGTGGSDLRCCQQPGLALRWG